MNRQKTLAYLRTNPKISVLIIGAGVNGIGVLRDLALQGVETLLIDRGDFCSGASAASSHMAHGGIRYLENGEFRLVREAVQERNRLIENAPHLVQPLPTVIPIFKWFSGLFNAPLKFLRLLDRPAERGLVVIKVGLMLYDAYTRGQGTVPPHQVAMHSVSRAKFPALNPDLLCTATYYDGSMPSPERICVEILGDAAEQSPVTAHVANYVSAVGMDQDAVQLKDEVSGEGFRVFPQVVINATGPWIDLANGALGQRTRFIGGTKGSHLVLNNPELREMIGEHEFFFENFDGRIVLILPLMDKVILGTTDIKVDDPDAVRCMEDEVEYFMTMTKKIFPEIAIQREQIVFRFSGVRPLPAADAKTTGQISRDHEVRETTLPTGTPVLSLVGGKWTTYRAFAEQVTDTVLARLGQTRRESTRSLPIGGGKEYPKNDAGRQAWVGRLRAETGLPRELLWTWLERYGTRASALAHFSITRPDAPLAAHAGYTRRELIWLAQNEMVVHLDDILLRRSLIGMLGETTLSLLVEMAEVVGETLGWDAAARRAEVQRTAVLFADRHDVKLT